MIPPSTSHATETIEASSASSAAVAAAAKSKPQTCRELERALRDLGFTQREAREITSHGFKATALDTQEDLSELVAALNRNSNLFEIIERKLT